MSPSSDFAGSGLAVRQVFAVTVGLSIEMAREALVPGLAPLIALALIAAPGPALSVGKGVGLAVLVSAIAVAVLSLSEIALSRAGLYAILVTVLYAWAFFLCFAPGTAALGRLFLMMAVSVSALTAGSELLAAVIVEDMITSVAVGVGLVLAAQALAPPRAIAAAPSGPPPPPVARAPRALIATAIMVPAHLYLTFDGIAAVVILITAATMLTEPGWGRFKAYATVFASGNLIGGLLALAAALITAAQPAFAVFVTTVAAIAALVAYLGQRRARLAPIFAAAGSAFALLFGMTLSPLATGADVAVLTRVLQILVAIVYVLGATSLALLAVDILRGRRDGAGEPAHARP